MEAETAWALVSAMLIEHIEIMKIQCLAQSNPPQKVTLACIACLFLTLFFLIIFYFPGIERTDRNDLIQNAGADATGDLHEPTSVSEINMVMD